MQPIRNFAQLVEAAKLHGPVTIAVAAAQELHVLEAVCAAYTAGLIRPILVGDEEAICCIAAEHGLCVDDFPIIYAADAHSAAAIAVRLVHEGDAQVLMKGKLETSELLRAVLNRQCGLANGDLLSFIWISQVPTLDRLLFISDPGVVIKPTVEQKMQIAQHCIDTAHRLGIHRPRVAILAARDEVCPEELASSDAAALSKMAQRGQITGAYVDGPLDLDSAIAPTVASQHHLRGPVVGQADILIVPHIEAGNILAKGLTYFAHAVSASVVVGARAPIVLTSRSDSSESKLASIALGVMLTPHHAHVSQPASELVLSALPN